MLKRKLTDHEKEPFPKRRKEMPRNWTFGLFHAIQDEKLLIKSDDLVYVINDKYPKAKFHYLIIPKDEIDNLTQLRRRHTNLLAHMEKVAKDVANDYKHRGRRFKIGFHAQPSLKPLHLHVISDDFVSNFLKSKWHWNSFVTNFFLNCRDVIINLERNGRVLMPSDYDCYMYKHMSLICHKCGYIPWGWRDLKAHLIYHL